MQKIVQAKPIGREQAHRSVRFSGTGSLSPHPWIHHVIDQIGEKIHQHVRESNRQQTALHQRVIAV
jgi:hypothetical protein